MVLPSISMNADKKPTIPEFFSGQTIFITGGTGFVGKVLIEKLLRDCPNIKTLYLILRAKRNKSPRERWSAITEEPLFDVLKKEQPNGLDKIVLLDGDISQKDLGLSTADKKLIEDTVTLIFHVAASVRFDDSLKTALLINTYGTYEVVQLAKNAPFLQCLVYVSSTYANAHLQTTQIEEKIYENEFSFEDLLQLGMSSDQFNLEYLRYKILGRHPNTYTFSKNLAEQVVNNVRKELPVIITRPSVVCNSLLGPAPGWIDNMNGIQMMSVAIIKGVQRVGLWDDSCYLDYSPVDYVINGIIVATWYNVVNNKCKNDDLPVYNIAYANVVTTRFKDLVEKGFQLVQTKPYKDAFWYPLIVWTSSPFLYYIYFWTLQIIPAIIADVVLWFRGKKIIALKLTRKLYMLNYRVLRRFTFESYNFTNNDFKALWSKVQPTDKDIFYLEFYSIDLFELFEVCHDGMRRYLFKEDDSNLEESKARIKRLYWIHRALQGVVCSLFGYFLWTTGLPMLTSAVF